MPFGHQLLCTFRTHFVLGIRFLQLKLFIIKFSSSFVVVVFFSSLLVDIYVICKSAHGFARFAWNQCNFPSKSRTSDGQGRVLVILWQLIGRALRPLLPKFEKKINSANSSSLLFACSWSLDLACERSLSIMPTNRNAKFTILNVIQ